MGQGNYGCANLLGECPSGSSRLKCIWGYCPLDFAVDPYSPVCVLESDCHSFCGAGKYQGDCSLVSEIPTDYFNWMKEFENFPLNQVTVLGAHHSDAVLKSLNFDLLVEVDEK